MCAECFHNATFFMVYIQPLWIQTIVCLKNVGWVVRGKIPALNAGTPNHVQSIAIDPARGRTATATVMTGKRTK